MRYSIDPGGVTELVAEVSALADEIESHRRAALQAVDAAESALLTGADSVRTALGEVFARRRVTATAVSTRLSEILTGIEDATHAYVAGDDEMVTRTAAALPDTAPQMLEASEYHGAFSGGPR
ncbi:DUF6507 family protein [Microbacterium arborescens]|uniref:DUF6507 family protein n=1 Tax=Microbacterium arborescens TaxID=33883 RepID=UPI002786458D|nr:DUF6507 family protein [Microbacterium arborescens]MDQ1218439.1 hypothetical protein [Microbacterium arborescens]